MATGHVVVLEGPCSSGKSTTLRLWDDPNRCVLLPEGAAFAANPPAPPQTTSEAVSNDTFFLALDAERSQRARTLQLAGDDVLVERDVLGTLSIAYGYDPLYHSFHHTGATFLRLLSERHFAAPTAYVVFQASYDTIQRRLSERSVRKSFIGPGWTDAGAYERQSVFLGWCFSRLRRIPTYYIDANADSEDRLILLKTYLDDILQHPPTSLVAMDRSYQDELAAVVEGLLDAHRTNVWP